VADMLFLIPVAAYKLQHQNQRSDVCSGIQVLHRSKIKMFTNMQGASKRASQWYSKGYCEASVTKRFILEGVQTILVQGIESHLPRITSINSQS
jgi:hypothetical protein